MSKYLLSKSPWGFPSIFSELDTLNTTPGLSVYEDEKNMYVEMHVPGIDQKDIRVESNRGYLMVVAEKTEEEKTDKKYYRKSQNAFSYEMRIPDHVDAKNPCAELKQGVLTVCFAKLAEKETGNVIKVHETV